MLTSARLTIWPTTAFVINRQRNTHAGEYNTPISVHEGAWPSTHTTGMYIYYTPWQSLSIVSDYDSIVVVRLSKNKRQQRLQYVNLTRPHKPCMYPAGEDVAKLHILSETTKKVRFILHHPYATPHPLPAPLNRHRRRRFADVVEVGRPTSTMSVLRHKLLLST